jgi:hypothetical protein
VLTSLGTKAPRNEDEWGSVGIVSLFYAVALDGNEWSVSRTDTLTHVERTPGIHLADAG